MRTLPRPCTLLVVLASLVTLRAQIPPPQSTFRTEARYVRVDMYASQAGRALADLRRDDVELLEDGIPQAIESFEYVHVPPAGRGPRVEPETLRASDAAATNPRARVFVLFLDTYHLTQGGAYNLRAPLERMLDRLLGADDLIAVMTPEMSASDLSFTRRPRSITDLVEQWWVVGRRDQAAQRDAIESMYDMCYPPPVGDVRNTSDVASELADRRREKLALEALENLVIHLRGVREERKAVLAVTTGWRLFGPNDSLTAQSGRIPRAPLRTTPPEPTSAKPEIYQGDDPQSRCERDAVMLAMEDHRTQFRELLQDANRANVTFYPFDPRGLVAFDEPIGPLRPAPPSVDRARLQTRQDAMRDMALQTDGLAIVNTSNLDAGLKRITDDLSAYYLIGYYSTNDKLDGGLRRISVRVRRPGTEVRARSSYRAPTARDVATTVAAGARPVPAGAPDARALGDALATLTPRPEAPLKLRAAAAWLRDAAAAGARVWIAGELSVSALGRSAAGLVADASLLGPATADVRGAAVAPDGRFNVTVPTAPPLPAGRYSARVRVRGADGQVLAADTIEVVVDGGAGWRAEPRLSRRTGALVRPAADPRFRRNEIVRVEWSVPVGERVTGRLLDRAGQGIDAIPLTMNERPGDAPAWRWVVAEVSPAPLAPGQYVVALTAGATRALTAFQLVP